MPKRPHILIIISHDTGRHVGPYGAGVATPNLERLAAEGIRFDRSFCVAAQCSPSRSSLMTGRYPHVNGLLGLAHLGWSMNPGERCLPHYLNEAGYETHLFGFQHETPEASIDRLGYQQVHRAPDNFVHNVAPLVTRFLETGSPDRERPLFLMVGFEEAHRPFEQPFYTPDDPASVTVPPYLPDNPGIREDLAWFNGSVRALDEGVGAVLGALDAAGLSQETLVIYTTDHGIAFPRAKGMSYDAGLETALIMRWPGQIAPATVSGQIVTHLDLLPTLLEVAGRPQPEGLNGQSYLPLLTGQSGRGPRDQFFFEMTWHDRYNPHRGIRTERYKYIRNFEPEGTRIYVPLDIHSGPAGRELPAHYYGEHRPLEELYNLESDPLERRNLAGDPAHAAMLIDLRTRVQRWMEETNDPLLKGPVAPTREQARIDWSP